MKMFYKIGFTGGLLFLAGAGACITRFLWVMTDTSFGPGGGGRTYSNIARSKANPVFARDTELCLGVTQGRWIGCDLSVPEAAAGDKMGLAHAQGQAGQTGAQATTKSVSSPGKVKEEIIEIGTQGEALAFNRSEIIVTAGSTVILKFKNSAVQSKMPHNWVLVAPGSEAKVANAGIAAGEAKNWVPELPEVLAHTILVQGGGEAEVKFTAPSSGRYPYICTFPGHYLSMKGILIVN